MPLIGRVNVCGRKIFLKGRLLSGQGGGRRKVLLVIRNSGGVLGRMGYVYRKGTQGSGGKVETFLGTRAYHSETLGQTGTE